MKRILTLVAVLALAFAGSLQAALWDRGGGLIYDDILNITWLQNANYAKTSGYDSDGRMTWSSATAWAANLSYYDSVRNLTWTDWRLPKTLPVNGTNYTYDHAFDGFTDYGCNVSSPGSVYAFSHGSEMAYLYYNSLGNKSFFDLSGGGYQEGFGLKNTGPFNNLNPSFYWSGTENESNIENAWFFFFYNGSQSHAPKEDNVLYVLAVRDGDVAPVPLPSAALLFGSGLAMVWGRIAWDRRKKRP